MNVTSLVQFIACILFGILTHQANGQNLSTLNTGGADSISNEGASASFSIGQLFYTSMNDMNMTVSAGVQQGAANENTFGITKPENSITVSAYPNPMLEYLYIEISDLAIQGYSFELYDINGKLLLSQELMDQRTRITPNLTGNSSYLMTIFNKGKLIKTFKILKG